MDNEKKKSSVPYGAILGALAGGAGVGYKGYKVAKNAKMFDRGPDSIPGMANYATIGTGLGALIKGAIPGGYVGHEIQGGGGDYEGGGEITGDVAGLLAGDAIISKLKLYPSSMQEMTESMMGVKGRGAQAKIIGAALGLTAAGYAGNKVGKYIGTKFSDPSALKAKEAEEAALMAEIAAAKEKRIADRGGKPSALSTTAAVLGSGLLAGGLARRYGGEAIGKKFKGDARARKIFEVIGGHARHKKTADKLFDKVLANEVAGGRIAGSIGALAGGTAGGLGWHHAMDKSDQYRSPLE